MREIVIPATHEVKHNNSMKVEINFNSNDRSIKISGLYSVDHADKVIYIVDKQNVLGTFAALQGAFEDIVNHGEDPLSYTVGYLVNFKRRTKNASASSSERYASPLLTGEFRNRFIFFSS